VGNGVRRTVNIFVTTGFKSEGEKTASLASGGKKTIATQWEGVGKHIWLECYKKRGQGKRRKRGKKGGEFMDVLKEQVGKREVSGPTLAKLKREKKENKFSV